MAPGQIPANSAPKIGRLLPRHAAVGCLAVAVLLSSTAAFADPVRLVTSGFASQLVEDGETGFVFAGSDFWFNGEVSWRPVETCGACTPGTTVDLLTGTMTPNLFPPSSATIDGRTFESIYFSGNFSFDAGSLTVPDVPVGSAGIFPTTAFTFTGSLAGYADSSLTGTPLFSTQLMGSGTASLGFFNYPSNTGISTDGFNFEFEDAAPTPEPGSLLLFGSGATWVASRWRRRRVTAAA